MMLWQTGNRLLCDKCLEADGIFGGDGRPALKSGKCRKCKMLDEGLAMTLQSARSHANHSRSEAAKWIGCARERIQEWEAADAQPNAASVERIMGYIRAFGKARF